MASSLLLSFNQASSHFPKGSVQRAAAMTGVSGGLLRGFQEVWVLVPLYTCTQRTYQREYKRTGMCARMSTHSPTLGTLHARMHTHSRAHAHTQHVAFTHVHIAHVYMCAHTCTHSCTQRIACTHAHSPHRHAHVHKHARELTYTHSAHCTHVCMHADTPTRASEAGQAEPELSSQPDS